MSSSSLVNSPSSYQATAWHHLHFFGRHFFVHFHFFGALLTASKASSRASRGDLGLSSRGVPRSTEPLSTRLSCNKHKCKNTTTNTNTKIQLPRSTEPLSTRLSCNKHKCKIQIQIQKYNCQGQLTHCLLDCPVLHVSKTLNTIRMKLAAKLR